MKKIKKTAIKKKPAKKTPIKKKPAKKTPIKKKKSLILRIIKLQHSLKPEINFKINFSLEKNIQAFFDFFASKTLFPNGTIKIKTLYLKSMFIF